MTAKRADRRVGIEYPHDIRARLSVPQYALLQLMAEHYDVGVSAALRLVLDDVIDGVAIEGAEPLRSVRAITPDPTWAARHRDSEE